jgi:hypothetical protein
LLAWVRGICLVSVKIPLPAYPPNGLNEQIFLVIFY